MGGSGLGRRLEALYRNSKMLRLPTLWGGWLFIMAHLRWSKESWGPHFGTDLLGLTSGSGAESVHRSCRKTELRASLADSGLEFTRLNLKGGDDTAYLHSTLESMAVEANGNRGDDTFFVGSGPRAVKIISRSATADRR